MFLTPLFYYLSLNDKPELFTVEEDLKREGCIKVIVIHTK